MKASLQNRIAEIKRTALMELRESMGPVELVNWWNRFKADIRDAHNFEDLDHETQQLIIKWEALSKNG